MTRAMKSSGIEWIGEIPKHWQTQRIKYVIQQRDSGSWGENELGDNNDIICIRVADFDYNHFNIKDSQQYTLRNYSPELVHYLKLNKGDILIEKSGGGEKTPVGRTVIFDKDFTALFANFIERIVVNNKIYFKYFQYIFSSFYMQGHTKLYIKQTTGIQNLNITNLFNTERITLPPLSEQQAIADFLDDKCAEIDNLSAAITEQIEVLKQYKKSVITEAVTKGLDPNAPMKDSGVEWIGEIPEKWEVEKLKYNLYRINTLNTGNNIVLSLYRDYGVIPKDSRDDNHNVTSQDTSKYRQVAIGNFVVNKMKAWQGSVAVSNYRGIVSPAYYVYGFRNKNINKLYFHYLMRSCYKDEFRRLSGGIREGQWDLPAEALENTLIIIPSFSEQKAIADYLDNKCAQIDSVIKDKESQLETLAAYKKSLIYEYVTGKKEVPQLKEV